MEDFTLAVDRIIGRSLANGPEGRARAGAAIRLARTDSERAYALRRVMAARAEWRRYVTVQQRFWMQHVSRRQSRARHHDSVSIRERYVRCSR